jgi:hypothetical protein
MMSQFVSTLVSRCRVIVGCLFDVSLLIESVTSNVGCRLQKSDFLTAHDQNWGKKAWFLGQPTSNEDKGFREKLGSVIPYWLRVYESRMKVGSSLKVWGVNCT